MIINPLWFYLISVSSNLQIVCAVIAIFALILFFITILMYPLFVDMNIKPKDWILKSVIVGTIFGFIAILVPSKETCYQMMVASLVTKENIEITAEAGKKAIDYIVDSIDKLLDEQEED